MPTAKAVVHFAGAGFLRTTRDSSAKLIQVLSLFPKSGATYNTMRHVTQLTFAAADLSGPYPKGLPGIPIVGGAAESLVQVPLENATRVTIGSSATALIESSDPSANFENLIPGHDHMKGLRPFSDDVYAAGVQVLGGEVATYDRASGNWPGTYGGQGSPNDRAKVVVEYQHVLEVRIQNRSSGGDWRIELQRKDNELPISITSLPERLPGPLSGIHYGVLQTAETAAGPSKPQWPEPRDSANTQTFELGLFTWPSPACPYVWFQAADPDDSFPG